MDMNKLLQVAYDLITDAQLKNLNNNERIATKNLVKLRELLNDQPELEAGGSVETDKCKGCGFRIAKGAEYCGECVCENDFDS